MAIPWLTLIALAAWPALMLYPAQAIAIGVANPWRWGEARQSRLTNNHIVLAGLGPLLWWLVQL